MTNKETNLLGIEVSNTLAMYVHHAAIADNGFGHFCGEGWEAGRLHIFPSWYQQPIF